MSLSNVVALVLFLVAAIIAFIGAWDNGVVLGFIASGLAATQVKF